MKIPDIVIGDRKIGNDHPCFIIAEAGVNHNGSLDLASKLIDKAKRSEADAIKFQTWKTENLVKKGAFLAEYQKENVPQIDTQFDLLKSLELSFNDFEYLKEYAEEAGLIFLSSPFDIESADFLNNIGIQAFKIPSGEIINPLLLDQIASYQKPIIMSSGMATLVDIEFALNRFYKQNNREIILLHCITSYPAKIEESNVNAIPLLKKKFGHLVGLSDHTLGTLVPILALGKGIVVLEKHFTLDKEMEGPDHKASMNPEEMVNLVEKIRLAEKALGTGEKIPTASEIEISKAVRKSIVSSKEIKAGDELTKFNLTVKRPGTGIDPRKIDFILGKKAKIDIAEDTIIEKKMIDD